MTNYTINTHEFFALRPLTLLANDEGAPDTLTITATGILEQTTLGISALAMQSGTSLDNSGSILGTAIGVEMLGVAAITNRAGGLIKASDAAISTVDYGAFIVNEAGGRISGVTTGIRSTTADVTIENYGTISGQVAVHVLENARHGSFVTLFNAGDLISTTTLVGAYAVRLNNALFSEFENAGTVIGAVHVFGDFGADVINSGAIYGDVYINSHAPSGNGYRGVGAGRVDGTIYTGNSDSYLKGGSLVDKFVAAAGDDAIFGGAGNDVINSGAGSNTITGGAGADVLISGGTRDVFVYEASSESASFNNSVDTIRGFDFSDVIDLSAVGGSADRVFIGANAFQDNDKFQVRVTSKYGMHHIEVDTNGNGVRDMYIWVQQGQWEPLTAADFILV